MKVFLIALIVIVAMFLITFAVAIGVDVGMTTFFDKHNSAVIKGTGKRNESKK